MKSAVIFYSYSGNTKKVAAILSGILRDKGEVEVIELIPTDESKNFFSQAGRAFKKKRAQIGEVKFDLSDCEMICLGTPVWAFAPAPALNTYLDKCSGIAGKKIVLFSTYGSGTGKEKCLDYMQDILAQKGAQDFKRFSIQSKKVKDKDFVAATINSTLSTS